MVSVDVGVVEEVDLTDEVSSPSGKVDLDYMQNCHCYRYIKIYLSRGGGDFISQIHLLHHTNVH